MTLSKGVRCAVHEHGAVASRVCVCVLCLCVWLCARTRVCVCVCVCVCPCPRPRLLPWARWRNLTRLEHRRYRSARALPHPLHASAPRRRTCVVSGSFWPTVPPTHTARVHIPLWKKVGGNYCQRRNGRGDAGCAGSVRRRVVHHAVELPADADCHQGNTITWAQAPIYAAGTMRSCAVLTRASTLRSGLCAVLCCAVPCGAVRCVLYAVRRTVPFC